jgi:hypothetical protein
MIDRLAWQINRKRGERCRSKYPQMVLPGLEEEPYRINLRNGQRPRLNYATTSQVEDHVKLLRSRFQGSTRLKRMEAIAEIMRRYVDDNIGITWSEVKAKELERRDFERLVGS